MGYTTQFSGILKFTNPLTAEEELALQPLMGEDTDSLKKNDAIDFVMPEGWRGGYIQLEIAKDKSGLQWDGSEKFYNAVETVNSVIMTMQKKFPDFGLKGGLIAQGEGVGDVWKLLIKDGKAIGEDIKIEIED